jgi:hypothetical protein
VDWTLMVEWDIRTIRMPGQPIEAGTPFGAMALLCARLIFPAVVGICPLAGQGEGSSAIAERDSISAGGLAGSLPNAESGAQVE